MKKLISAFLLGFGLVCVSAQTNGKDIFFKDYVSRTWNSENGIPGNAITDIIQSEDGYIFFGTYSGLVRFDGVEFVTLNKISNPEYGFLSARAVIEDSNGNIWVGSNDEGAFCLKNDGSVVSFSLDNGLSNNSVRGFCEDQEGNVWIGTASGINCVSSELKLQQLNGFDKLPMENHILVNQLYCDTAGRIWIITEGENGVYIYSDRKFSHYEGIHSVENPTVTSITQDSNGAFIFGVAPYYAVKMDAGVETIHEIGNGEKRGTKVTSIFQDSSKNIWFGLDNGLSIYHSGAFTSYNSFESIQNESITKIIEDKEKNIWIATDNGGLVKLSYGKFQTTSMSTTINAICQDKSRNVVWLAGDNGVYCYKNNEFIENKLTEYCKNMRSRYVAMTKDGSLLVSTYNASGLVKYDSNGNIKNWTKADGLAGDKVRVAQELSDGRIIVGTTTGLSIIDKEGIITNTTNESGLTNDYIMCVYEDYDGNVWVGTDGGGIFLIKDGKVVKHYTKENGLAGNVIFKIEEIRDNEIWITTGSGVTRMIGDKIYVYDSSKGFGTDGVFQVISDYTSRIWGTSNRGIFNLKLTDIEKVSEGSKETLVPKYYNRLDGIISSGVTSTSLSMKDDLGRIWFTLIDGFTIYDPLRNASNISAPVVKIQKAIVDSEEVSTASGKIVLSPKSKRITIKYTGISFISSEQVTFKYKLEGFDKDYTDWATFRNATYTNLKPGTYKFYVLAQNGDEVGNEEPEILTIVKKPYLWQRPWFITLIVLFVVGIISHKILRKIKKLREEKERVEKLSLEIISALVGTIDAKDKYTKGHSKRVADYSVKLAEKLGMNEEERKGLYFTAFLHDIGKIGTPTTIINKPGKLTPEEYEEIKKHSVTGANILSKISLLPNIEVGALGHHERYDGKGYPNNIKGEDIPYWARIICVADSYDAMTSYRSYRGALPQDVVRNEIEKNIGTQFDPEIAKKMLEIIDEDTDYELREHKDN